MKKIFVGYDGQTDKVFRVFDPNKGRVERVADVDIIDEEKKEQICLIFPIEQEPLEDDQESSENECDHQKEEDEVFYSADNTLEQDLQISQNQRMKSLSEKSLRGNIRRECFLQHS